HATRLLRGTGLRRRGPARRPRARGRPARRPKLCVAERPERDRVQDPDPRTLARAREGDLGAFEELVRAYQADVFRFAWHLTRDRTMAEDVTQDAFLRAFRFLRTYRGDSKFSSWLFRITRNCAMDAMRRQRSLVARHERQGEVAASLADPV